MATLNIGGKRVKVDDTFLAMSPEQQQATVEEIASQITPGMTAGQQAMQNASLMSQSLKGGPGPKVTPAPAGPNLLESAAATVNGLTAAVPFLQPVTDAIGGGISQLTGGDSGQYVDRQQAIRAELARKAPIARLSGEVAGYLGGGAALAGTKTGAAALGLTGTLPQRIGASAASSAGLGTADAMSRGEAPLDALAQGGVSGAIGGAIPVVGVGLRAAGRGIADNFIRPIATAANRENEVTRRLATAIGQDTAAGARMTPAMERTAQRAGATVTNADRFGSAIRGLARTSANVSDEARNAFTNLTQDRFSTQGQRAVGFVRQLMNGATDDLALQDALRTAAQQTNRKAYDAAMNSPAARAVWSQPIRELMQSDTFRSAIRAAESRGTDKAAVSGFAAVRNPFTFGANGEVGLKTMPDGSRALPSLAFWDQVKRNLDGMIGTAKRSGDNAMTADLMAIKQKLVGALDQAVPSYAQARRGAAGFFGAEDAIEAGRKAVTSPKAVPEIERAVAAMSQAEKDAFAVGFSSEIIDAISATRDRVNVINSIFGSESARQRIAIALGPQKARELEAFVKTEQVLDLLRNATQGNSTTAQQLIAAGVIGSSTALWTGDAGTGLNVATLAYLGRRGAQMLGKRVDDQVMKRVAEVLSSTDPSQLQRAIQNAALSKQHMEALDALLMALGAGARGAALATAGD